MRKIIIVGCLATVLAGCQNLSNQDVGTVAGGLLGGALGTQVGHGSGRAIATIGGTLIGGLIGGAVGKNMDDTDRLKMNQALESGHSNQTVAWRNPDTGASYRVQPTRTFMQGDQPCREFTQTAMIGGKRQQVYGTACRQGDGSWRVVSQS